MENVEEILEQILIHGGEKCGEITRKEIAGSGTITFVYARDPEGNLIEIQNWK